MFIIVQWTQFWYKHTMCLHVLHVTVYCVYHQVRIALTITLLSICYTPCTGQCLYIGSALYMYVVYVMPLCYKIYEILNIKF
jgi:hypothetical protein